MKRKLLMAVAAGAMAASVSAALPATAAAQDIGLRELPCSAEFVQPWGPGAWSPPQKVVFSPFGTADIHCTYFHGFVAAYQIDPWGNKHHLNITNLGPWSNYTYFWDPATF